MSSNTASKFKWNGFQVAQLPQVPSWVETLGRAGHIAKGCVYFIVGILAFRVAIDAGGEIGGARNAIEEIGKQPFGQALLLLVAIGLIGYTAWRWVQAIQNTEGADDDAKGIAKRVGYGASGVTYLGLGLYAGALVFGFTSGSGDSGQQPSFLLDSTWGRAMLGIVGTGIAIAGGYFVYQGWKAKFMEQYNLARMSETLRQTAYHAGRMGLITRGIAFAIIGYFLLRSAWFGASGEIAGMGDALSAIAAQTYGKFLLGVVGFGLMAYAVHMALLGWYRRFNVQS
ncbi:DUF1206 domain-containing protein [Roseiconus lacunae]|uniref:DUF1206 domain-containing protein n=1 Tax=Roseiconus lacunae TaxID=2605694 RepID=A0ABT7PHK7_9BACT|nr:DUF1206 domain-containing protein [Roseiconus lacunae]MCD0458230.1 DUF1206 domain-containing protein [Roseiconus lacunae]MDM4015676.1 DUF1206 domain-containing protein [Roseiconus lacunae]WRQ52271.1 DUF1206 domain-containing protein [Stieleria sp. HD01]